ncbi:hypothetical protein D3C81_2110490 [compost metagenome]
MARVIFQHIVNGTAGGVAVNHHAFAGRATQQLIKRHIRGFRFDIPQRHINGRYRRHRDRTTTPVRAFVEELPDVFNAVRVAANKLRTHMVLQIGRNG